MSHFRFGVWPTIRSLPGALREKDREAHGFWSAGIILALLFLGFLKTL
jgi:hypothetical protein